ncbi:MAG: nuclear transport factor 2 family protein [Nitritalea sp.]
MRAQVNHSRKAIQTAEPGISGAYLPLGLKFTFYKLLYTSWLPCLLFSFAASAYGQKKPQPPELLRAYCEAFQAQDAVAMAHLLHADFQLLDVEGGLIVAGREDFTALYSRFFSRMPDMKVTFSIYQERGGTWIVEQEIQRQPNAKVQKERFAFDFDDTYIHSMRYRFVHK